MTKQVDLWQEKKAFTIAKWAAIIIAIPFGIIAIVSIYYANPYYAAEVLGYGVGYGVGYGLFIGLLAWGFIKLRNWRQLKA